MRYLSYVLSTFTIALLVQPSKAQEAADLYRYSNLSSQGTARSMGFGGALGSVGADFSTLSVNPAGIGLYHTSEMNITPSLKMNSATGDYLSTSSSENNTKFNFNNFGLILNHTNRGRRAQHENWKSYSFGFGFNRLADYNHNYSYRGVNHNSSITQAFESYANQYPGDTSYSDNLAYLGYQSYLLTSPDTNGRMSTVVPFANGVQQTKYVSESGHMNEVVFSFGGNYKEQLMLGGTIGVPYINYRREDYITEALAPGNAGNNYFSSLRYYETLQTTGSGVNLKLGAIYKITDEFRVGAAFHSPSWISMHDEFNNGVSSVILDANGAKVPVGPFNNTTNTFDYTITTPWKGLLSATYLFNKMGFISLDYEYVDYASMRYTYEANYTDAQYSVNQSIKDNYKGASNIRVGAEVKVAPAFMVRAGYGYYGNAYKNSSVDAARTDISLGLGYRVNHFYMDLAYVRSMYKDYEVPYSFDNSFVKSPVSSFPVAKLNYALNNVALTFGLKF
jgi:Outer membrane protein transport protein (OMPP1/FadL/TodX)